MSKRVYAISAEEAVAKFSDLLQKVNDGGKVIITKDGELVAQLTQVRKPHPSVEDAINLGTPLPKKLTITLGGPDDSDPFERAAKEYGVPVERVREAWDRKVVELVFPRLAELGATIDLYRKGNIDEQDEDELRLLFGSAKAESIKRDVEKMISDRNAREKG